MTIPSLPALYIVLAIHPSEPSAGPTGVQELLSQPRKATLSITTHQKTKKKDRKSTNNNVKALSSDLEGAICSKW